MILLRQISVLLLGSLATTLADDTSIPTRELVDRQIALATAEIQTEKMLAVVGGEAAGRTGAPSGQAGAVAA